jgi:HEAT repeat protein/beta-lactamase regulating signal transducer with metallopeptidase domain
MIDKLSSSMLAWLLTYLIHSTALLALAWALTRVRTWSPAAIDLLWKTAFVGALFTATVQSRFDVRPAGSVSLERTSSPVASSESTASRDDVPALEPHVVADPTAEHKSTTSSTIARPAALAPAAASLPVQSIAVIAWAFIALALTLSYAARRLILVGRIGDRSAVHDGRLLAELETLVRHARLRRRPRLTCTSRISSPIALGIAEICVPESALTELDEEQQRSMLAHELAHLVRRDPLWLAFASVIERVFWFQPLNRIARRQIATSAEYLCDEWAVHRTGSGVALARCLAQVAEWIQASPLGVPVAGMAEERSLLVSRVEKLLSTRATPRSARWLGVGAVAVVLATIAIAPSVTGRAARATALGLPADETAARDSQPANAPHDVAAEDAGASAAHRASSDSTVVLALIARLKDEDAGVRAAAAQSLGKLEDPRAVPALIGALGDRDAKVRAAAAESLGQFKDPRAISGLSALLADAELDVRKGALEALGEYEEGVPVAGIIRLLDDQDAQLRHSAAHAIGRLGDRTAGAAVARLVRDPSPDVRQAAIEAIAQLHDAAHAAAILPALTDANADVRHQALDALDDLRSAIPEPTLLALLRDPNADVRAKAAEIAGERSVLGAIPSLRRMIEDPDADVRENAVSALANIADDSASEALRAALTSKDAKVRRAAVEALGDRRQ